MTIKAKSPNLLTTTSITKKTINSTRVDITRNNNYRTDFSHATTLTMGNNVDYLKGKIRYILSISHTCTCAILLLAVTAHTRFLVVSSLQHDVPFSFNTTATGVRLRNNNNRHDIIRTYVSRESSVASSFSSPPPSEQGSKNLSHRAFIEE